jgi:hypothetical protein
MGNLLILLLLDIAALAGMFVYFNNRIHKNMEPDVLLGKVRDEVNRMLLELNQTTDRNIDLLEDRIKSLHEVLQAADHRISLMKREVDKRASETATYTELGKHLPRMAVSVEPPPREAIPQRPIPSIPSIPAVPETPKPHTVEEPEAPYVSGGSRDVPDAAKTRGPELPVTERPAGPSLPTEGRQSQAAFPVNPEPGAVRIQRSAEQIDIRKPLPERALELYRMGFTAELIASRLGRTVGEIELMLSLEERKGDFGERDTGN